MTENFVVLDNSWLLFEGGSLVERTAGGSAGMTREPPTDLHELSKLKVMFWQRKLGLAVEEFDTRRNHLLNAARNRLQESETTGANPGGPPMTTEEATALLSELRQKVKRCQRELEKWENERARTEPKQSKHARELAEQNRGLLGSFISAVQGIEI